MSVNFLSRLNRRSFQSQSRSAQTPPFMNLIQVDFRRLVNMLALVAAIGTSYHVKAQCGLVEIPLAQRVQTSQLIVEGRVIASAASWDDLHQNIYTISTIEVLSTFKGTSDSVISIVTQGGLVGMDLEMATHSLELNPGKTGIFTLIPNGKPINGTNLYEAYAGTQGFLQYGRTERNAIGIFDRYEAVETELYPAIEVLTGIPQVRRKPLDWKRVSDLPYTLQSLLEVSEENHLTSDPIYGEVAAESVAAGATISGFSPTTVQAGRSVLITINGAGFGAAQGTSYVQFRNASASSGYISPSAGQYVSWSDTQIKVYVPSAAGTGNIRVSDGTNTVTSSSTVTVEYSILNVFYDSEYYLAPITNDNGSGGYTFQMNTAFDASTAAKTDFQNVVYAWRCATGISWTFGSVSTVTSSANDGTSVVRFDSGSELPAGTLGICVSRYTGCTDGSNIYFSLTEMDVSVDDGTNFFYGNSGSPSGSQYDFYSIMIHELGHGHQLGHVIDATKVMHYSISSGVQRRTLSTEELTGAAYVITYGTTNNNCAFSSHIQYSCNPTVTLTTSPATIQENGSATLTATLSQPAFSDVTVSLTLTGSAITGTDYTLATTITIPAGSTSASVTLAAIDDINDEPSESVIVNITGVTNGTESGTQVVTVNIADNDAPPFVAIYASSTSISETGGSSTITATISAASAYSVTVGLTLTGAATTGTDYTLGTSISIPAGSTTATLTLSAISDLLDEQNETVIIDITSVINCVESGTQTVTVTINDDDATPTVTLSASATSLNETSSNSSITATLSAISGQAVTVTLATSGTATQGTDYNLASTITIPAGFISSSTNLTTVNDLFDEPNETAVIDIASVLNAVESGTQTVTVTINDDDVPPVITMSASTTSITEGSSVTLTFTVSAYSGFPITINLGTSGTASGADYTLPATATIPAGSSTATVILAATDDFIYEASETVIVDIVSITNGTESGTQQQTITIFDTDNAPEAALSVNTTSISENGGSATITATLSIYTTTTVTVNLNATGTASTGADYTFTASITIPAGSISGTAVLLAVNDAVYEPAETVSIAISSVVNAGASSNPPITITINDDDTPPTVTLSAATNTLTEGTSTTITATLSTVSSQAVTVTLSTSGTAGASDFSLSATITIPAGSLSASVTFTANNNSVNEADETVIIDVSSVSNAIENGTQQQTITIVDNDPIPAVNAYLPSTSVSENAGTASLNFSCFPASGQAITFNMTYSGTASSGIDYSGVVSAILPAGTIVISVPLPITDDLIDEADETVEITIVAVNGVMSTPMPLTLTILDNDNSPTVTLSAAGTTLAENGSTAVTATLSAVSSLPVTVDLGFSGTASAGDYTAGTSITIPAGSTSASVLLTAVDDITDEADETVVISIASATNATAGGTAQTVTILDNDNMPTAALSLADATIAENGSTTVTATLSNPSSAVVTIDLGFSGTASAGDYTTGTTITIPAGSTSASVLLTAVDDITDEADETVVISIASATNATAGGTLQTVTILDNDNMPTAALSLADATIAENGSTTVTATLSNPSGADVTIDLGFSGTSSAGDYTTGTTITIPAGSTSASATLTATDDLLYEGDETVVISIASVTNATAGGTSQIVTILDNENAPLAALSSGNSSIAENGSTIITATLSTASSFPVTLNLVLSGSASATDYTVGTTIFIPPGSTFGSVTLAAIDDLIDETDENVVIAISSAINASDGGTEQYVTILDNDNTPEVLLSTADGTISENGSTTITATLSHPSSLAITVGLDFSGTASASDYTTGTSIVIQPGDLAGSITLSANDDLTDEADETVVLAIISVENGTTGGTAQTIIIQDNDDAPEIAAAANGTNQENGSTYNFGILASGTSASAEFTLTNTGSSDLLLSTLNITGAAYTIGTSGMNTTVGPGTSTTFTVTATGDCSADQLTGVLTIPNNDGDESNFTILLTAMSSDQDVPEISCPATINATTTIVDYTLPTATDNCSTPVLTLISGPAPGSVFPEGTTTVTYSATDEAGNSSTCSFNVIVEILGMDEQPVGEVKIYPNPASTSVTVSVPAGITGISIHDSRGALVLQSSLDAPVSVLATDGFANGIYYLTFFGDTAVVHKLEVVH